MPPPLTSAFMARVSKSPNGCWHWTGYIDPKTGYGTISAVSRSDGKRRTVPVHRFVYERQFGELPRRGEPGHLQVDHECHNQSQSCQGGPTCLHRRCVNPKHLVACPAGDNAGASGNTAVSKGRAMTHCAAGHELAGDNLGTQAGGRRYCKACQIERTSENRRKRLAKARGEGWQKVEHNTLKTHCPKGHPYDEENTYHFTNKSGTPGRGCRTCRKAASDRNYQKRMGRLQD